MKKNIFKKAAALMMAVAMSASVFVGCGSEEKKEEKRDISKLTPEEYYDVADWSAKESFIDDNYRNYYHIFVYSFADSNGDGIGDLNGITEKLDYIKEMGFNGIWLSPIHKSTTYHKYDVVDYYSIDPEYGTMDDFDRFISECEKRGIKVLLDFVFNHTSTKHEWFTEASKYMKNLNGKEPDASECPYIEYYNIVKNEDAKTGYNKLGDSGYSYECMFWDQMPDLNLGNETVRKEIEKAAKFWVDKGIGGFRLDAAKEYYSGSTEKNVEVLSWFTNYCKSLDENLYLVAEVWDSYATIRKYYKSGITSIFDYTYGSSSGYLVSHVNGSKGKELAEKFVETQDAYLESNPNMINAPFLSNHDCGRISGFAAAIPEKMKMLAALNAFMSGSSFVYYGEEIGLRGSGKDENKRAPMYWSDFAGAAGTCTGPAAMDKIEQSFGSLETQKKDKFSIYWYYRNLYHVKNMFPEIARGKVAVMDGIEDENICAVSKTYNGETVYILFNLGKEEKTVTVSHDKYDYKGLAASIEVDENKVTMKGETVKIPAYGIAVIK